MWSRDGRELFYKNGERMLAVSIETEPTFTPGNPSTVFEGPYLTPAPSFPRPYDVSPDGQRFLMIRLGGLTEAGARPSIVLVQHWFEELKRLVPVP